MGLIVHVDTRNFFFEFSSYNHRPVPQSSVLLNLLRPSPFQQCLAVAGRDFGLFLLQVRLASPNEFPRTLISAMFPRLIEPPLAASVYRQWKGGEEIRPRQIAPPRNPALLFKAVKCAPEFIRSPLTLRTVARTCLLSRPSAGIVVAMAIFPVQRTFFSFSFYHFGSVLLNESRDVRLQWNVIRSSLPFGCRIFSSHRTSAAAVRSFASCFFLCHRFHCFLLPSILIDRVLQPAQAPVL